MPSTLSTVTEIIWPSIPTEGGMNIGMRLCRTDPKFPGAGLYDASVGGTLFDNKIYLDRTLSPILVSDFELSQAFQATNGKSQLDNVSVQFIDVTKYAGTINSSGGPIAITEDFMAGTTDGTPYSDYIQTTFFTEFFNDTFPDVPGKNYPVCLWIDIFSGNGTHIEKSFLLHVDPNYKAQQQLITFSQDGYFTAYNRPETLHDGSLRTLQGVAAGTAFGSVQFQATLNIGGGGSGNFKQGAGYMGIMYQPSSSVCHGGFAANVFGSGDSNLNFMQACVYEASQVGTPSGIDNLYNEVAPNPFHGDGVQYPGLFWPDGLHLPWDVNHIGTSGIYTDNWWGPCGTWWISLGTLVNALCNSFGQLYASDGIIGPQTGYPYSSHDFYSASNQFSPTSVGQTITFSKPDNGAFATDTIATYVAPNHVTLTNAHSVVLIGGPLSWFIKGNTNAQILFDIDAQLGSGWAGMQYWPQKPDETNMCYPVDTGHGSYYPKDIYISVNAFLGSHPYDGSQFMNPVVFAPSQTLDNVLQGICNFLCCQYNVTVDQTTGQARLVLIPLGTTAGVFPKSWIPLGKTFQEVEPSTGSTAVIVQNVGDSQSIMCPLGPASESTSSFPVPIRMRTWGNAVPQSQDNFFLFNFFEAAYSPYQYLQAGGMSYIGGIVYDGSLDLQALGGQADDCFRSVRIGGGGNVINLNPDCWKGLCFAMFLDTTDANIMYPTATGLNTPLEQGSPGAHWSGLPSAGNAFYALGAEYGPGFSAVANDSNYQRFNSIDYQSVIFATYLIQLLGTIIQRDFFGTTDDGTNGGAGKLSVLDVGMTATWTYDGKIRTFQVITFPRYLIANTSAGVQMQEILSGGFPDITALVYGPVPGSSGSGGTSGSGVGTGGGPIGPGAISWQPTRLTTLTGTGLITIPSTDSAILATANTITGVNKPASPVAPQTLVITNKTGADWILGDFLIANNDTWVLYYDGTSTKSDPTLAEGWNIMGRSS